MLDSKKIGQIIRKTRKVSGLSQLELAQFAGIGKTAVFDIEKGKETVQVRTLMAVLKVLNIKLEIQAPVIIDG